MRSKPGATQAKRSQRRQGARRTAALNLVQFFEKKNGCPAWLWADWRFHNCLIDLNILHERLDTVLIVGLKICTSNE